jgi:hypothetical protein
MKRIHAIAALSCIAFTPMKFVSAQIAVLNEAVNERNVTPGQTYQGRLLIRNMGTEPQETRVYQTDYAYWADGKAAYDAPGTLARSNAKWMKLSSTYLVVPPGETVPILYDVTVPTDSAMVGTYWSMVMIEAIVAGSKDSRRPPNARVQFGLSVTTRYGTQIATHFGNSGASKLAFDCLTATSDSSGMRRLQYDFINTGQRAHRFAMSMELYNEAGELVKKASQVRGLLYPGTSARQNFEVGNIPHGTYTAVLVADAGGDQVFGGQFKVTY